MLSIGKNKIGTSIITFFVICGFHFGYSQTIVTRTSSNGCVGGSNTFSFPRSGCTVSWGATGNYTILSSSNNSLTIKWNAPIASAYVYANYHCSSSPTSGTQNSATFAISSPVVPTVGLGLSTTSVCQGSGSIILTATPMNGGTSPNFNWYVDNGPRVSYGTANTYTYSTSSLSASTHSIYVTMNVNGPLCVTSTLATSAPQNFTVVAKSTFSVNVGGPGTICSDFTSIGFTASATNINGSIGNLSYQWFGGGNRLAGTPPNNYVISTFGQGTQVYAIVTSDYSCVIPPVTSNTYTVNLTTAVAPTVSIGVPKTTYCAGELITFTASSSQITGSSTFIWTLNGATLSVPSTASSIQVPASTTPMSGYYYSTGSLSVTANNLSGTCLNPTSANGTFNSGILTIYALPVVTISSATTIIFSTQSLNISASGSGYTYQWKRDAVDISPGGTVNPYPASVAGTYSVVASANGCSKESNSLILTKNIAPVANAVLDQTLVLPTRSTTLVGTGTDADGTISAYTWRFVSGPSTLVLPIPTSASLSISELVIGDYFFGFKVTDNVGEQSSEKSITLHVIYPPNNFNRIVETDVFVKDQIDETNVNALLIQNKQKSVSIKYYNGLGYPMQTVVTQGSPLLKDIVKPVVYDEYGRNKKNYLPVTVNENNGYYKINENIIDAATGNYKGIAANFYSDFRPFSEATFEPSPLNRPTSEFGVGNDWYVDNKFTGYQYITNIHSIAPISLTAEKIAAWNISPTTGLPVRDYGYYGTGQLFIKSTKDEQGNEVREYTDNAGRVVLKKVQAVSTISSLNNNAEWALTYYIYDDFGNLRFVLQPLLSAQVLAGDTFIPNQVDLDKGGFQYKYDDRQRMIEKKVPGADPVYMVYDKLDRLVMTQDGNQRKVPGGTTVTKTEWSFIKYDALNRPVITGIYTHSAITDQAGMAGQISTSNFFETYTGAAPHGYSSVVFPTSGRVLTVTYYDNYKFRDDFAGTSSYSYSTGDITGQDGIENKDVIGLVTGSRTNILDDYTTNYLWSITYYDAKYRTLQVKTESPQNQGGGINRVSNLYDFVRLKESKSTHNKGATSYTAHRKFDYDHVGRLTETQHKFHTEPNFVILQRSSYNELGQMAAKKLHSRNTGSTFSQSIDYSYNIRGWLEKVNDLANPEASDLFSMEMRYNKPSASGGPQQYNGNISEIVWKSAGLDKQSYGYKYDPMNRLFEAKYYNLVRPLNNGRYNELIGDVATGRPAYDLNGNIKNLIRNGKLTATTYGLIDNLSYAYASNDNLLTSINDGQSDTNFDDGFKDLAEGVAEYSYDANGNLKEDQNKGITSITYNVLNLPNKVYKGATNYIVYTYDAAGRKLTQQVFGSTPKTTDYIGEYVYENGALQFVNHEEGRILPDVSVGAPHPYEYQYYLKDHLGNVRVTFSEKMITTEFKATLENVTHDDEVTKFNKYNQMGVLNEFDHTDAGIIYNRSHVLNGSSSYQVGLSKSFEVNPGDLIDMEVYAKYEAPTTPNPDVNSLFASLTSAFSLGLGVTPLDGVAAKNAIGGLFPLGGPFITSSKWEDAAAPKAYLNYILFDQNFTLVDFGFDQISVNAQQSFNLPIILVPHDLLSLHVKVQQKGYLYIYLSNENPAYVNVYFDDFKITYNTSVQQVSEYYAFGLKQNSNGYERQGLLKNLYQYNGKEVQDELGLGWLDYGARMYMPDIGRWGVVDQLAQLYYTSSPYSYVANNPINAYDIDGRKIIYVNGYFSRILNLMGLAPSAPKEEYWNFFSATFISSSRQFMGAESDETSMFIDGSSYFGGDQSGGDRYELGKQYATEHYAELIQGMKDGETLKFISHSEGGAFAAGMADYLRSKGLLVESMLYLSPDEADEFSHPIGIFSIQSSFQNDPISPPTRLNGVNFYVSFSTLNGSKITKSGAHGATVTTANLKKLKSVLVGKFGSSLMEIFGSSQWNITETKTGYRFTRVEEQKENENEDRNE